MIKFALILFALLPLINSKIFSIRVDVEDDDSEISRRYPKALSDDPKPPPHTELAATARYVVHNVEWTAMGTISTSDKIGIGFPMVNVVAIADSEKGAKSTGNIYFYLTMLDFTAKDLSKNNKLTALFTIEQNMACTKQKIDPMEPTCTRVIMSGEALRVPEGSAEHKFATKAFVSHHPASSAWIGTHDFFLCKLNISTICVLDWYGGAEYVSVDDYFKVDL